MSEQIQAAAEPPMGIDLRYVVWEASRWKRPLLRVLGRPIRRGYCGWVIAGDPYESAGELHVELKPTEPLRRFEDFS